MSAQELQALRPPPPTGLVAPQQSDMPPLPPSFRTLDVKREVERIRDARKKIKLDPSALALEKDNSSPQAVAARARALPSICTYTLHDVGDGFVCSIMPYDNFFDVSNTAHHALPFPRIPH